MLKKHLCNNIDVVEKGKREPMCVHSFFEQKTENKTNQQNANA